MPLTRITSNVITDGTIVNADISSSTIIDRTKLQLSSPAGVKTVYLAPRTDGIAGSGTELDPYDAGGATEQIAAEKYDNIIKDRTKCPNFCTIRLLPGQYFTRGSNEYQPGRPNSVFNLPFRADYPLACSVIGEGAGITKIKIVVGPTPSPAPLKYWGIKIFAEVDGSPYYSNEFYQNPVLIEGISIDGNWQVLREQNKSVCGLLANSGKLAIIRGCHAYNFGGDFNSGNESFVIGTQAYNGLALTESCLVTNEVDSWDGGDPYVSAIGANGMTYNYNPPGAPYQQVGSNGSAIVRNNVVIGGTTANPRTTAAGIGCFANLYAEASNNAVYNKAGGFYKDTGINQINVIKGNTFYNCVFGVHGNFDNSNIVYTWNHDLNWVIEDNTFWLPSGLPYYGPARITGALKCDFKRNIIRCIDPNGSFSNSMTRIQSCPQINTDENVFEKVNSGNFEITGIQGPCKHGKNKSLNGTEYADSYIPMLWDQNGTGINPGLVTITRSGSTATATVVNPSQTKLPRYVSEYKPIYRISGANQPEYNGIHRITITSDTTFTFPIEGTPVSPATGTILSYICTGSGSKDFYIEANNPDPLENGKQLRDAMLFCAQIRQFDGSVDFIANIYLSPGYYKFDNQTNSFFFGRFNVIGLGNAKNTIIDFGTQIVQPTYAIGFNSIGNSSNNRFSFKNVTITGRKSASVPVGVRSELISTTVNNYENTYENVIFDKGTHDVITFGGLRGIYKNCIFTGQVNTFGSATSSCVGKFYDCSFITTLFYGMQLQSSLINEFQNCNFELVSGTDESDMLLEGIIQNCTLKCSRAIKSRLSISEEYFTTIRDTKLDNIDLRISVGSNLPANPALRAEIYNTQIILPTGTTPAIVSQNANTNIRVSNLTTNAASPQKDSNTVIQTLTQIT